MGGKRWGKRRRAVERRARPCKRASVSLLITGLVCAALCPQQQMQLKIALARTLAKSARGDNPGLMLGLLGRCSSRAYERALQSLCPKTDIILAQRLSVCRHQLPVVICFCASSCVPPGGRAGQAASSSAAALGGVNAAGAAGQGDGTSTTPGGAATASGGAAAPDPSTVNSGASPAGAAGAGSTPVRSSTTAALAAVVNAAASSGAGGGEGLSGLGLGMSGGELGPEAAMLEELFEDANAADALNRELEASLARANADLVDLREKVG